MIANIKRAGHARTSAVETAMRTVARHSFVPDATHGDAYADIAVITKRAADGAALSCASVPTVVAMMLDQLAVGPGHNVLEIGAGTGYNAALLAHLTGPDGQVTTVDIDDEVTAGARRSLDATGNHHVHVITRDGARLISDRTDLCGFVPMIGQEGEHTGTIDTTGLVSLHDDVDQHVKPSHLLGVLEQPKVTVWSGVTVGPQDPFDGLWLNLTATDPGTCRIAADREAVTSGLCTPVIPIRSPAITDGTSIAYLVHRRLDGPDRLSELGATAHGPAAHQLADRFSAQITVWNHDRDHQPRIDAYPADAAVTAPRAGMVIAKPDTQLVLSP